jgi:hypothetical protein
VIILAIATRIVVVGMDLSVGLAHHLGELLLGQLPVPVPVVPLEHSVDLEE